MIAPTIIKLGGSLVVPKDIDIDFLRRFHTLIKKYVDDGRRFIIITGGGYTNRWYRDAAMALGIDAPIDLHWLGIRTTRVNAELLRALFGAAAYARPIFDLEDINEWNEPVLVAGGGSRPGVSTDFVTTEMAGRYGVQTVINMSDVAGLYTEDPKKNPNATLLREIAWKDYRAMFGNPTEHTPGAHIPIDAHASIKSQEMALETFFIGSDIENLERVLSGAGEWKGTRIH